MIDDIVRNITVPLSAESAFRNFVDHLNEWWPAEYTWSQSQLQKITIEAKVNGLCTELGPHGFRCDWGRIVAFEPNRSLSFLWQISSQRVPEPNPDRASLVSVVFSSTNDTTRVRFGHSGFEKHGEGGQAYREAMASDEGWNYILERYKACCEKSVQGSLGSIPIQT